MWFIPSRQRPQKALKCVQAMVCCGSVSPGAVIIDADDPMFEEYYFTPLPAGWSLHIGRSVPWFTDKLNLGLKSFSNEPWYGSISDDTYAKTPGFEQRLIEGAGAWGVATANDGWQARSDVNVGRMHGAGVYGGEFLRAWGCWYPEGFKHQFAEDVHETLCRRLGNWVTLMDVLTVHDHPLKTGGPMDDTFHQVNNPQMFNDGKARFEQWRRFEFEGSVEKIKTAAVKCYD